MTVEQVSVTFPNGTATQIDNPLYDYNFHPLDNREINGTVSTSIFSNPDSSFDEIRAVRFSLVEERPLEVYLKSVKTTIGQFVLVKQQVTILH